MSKNKKLRRTHKLAAALDALPMIINRDPIAFKAAIEERQISNKTIYMALEKLGYKWISVYPGYGMWSPNMASWLSNLRAQLPKPARLHVQAERVQEHEVIETTLKPDGGEIIERTLNRDTLNVQTVV